MDLFNLMAKLSLDSAGFESGVTNADKSGKNLAGKLEKSFNKIQKVAKVVFTGYLTKTVTSTMKRVVMETANFGDVIDKQSQVLGLSRKAYQEWDYILGQNGASIDDMSVSMRTMNSLLLSAGEDGQEAKDALSKLGVSMNMISSMPVEDQFNYIVQAFQKLPQGANKSALAVKLFGRNGLNLLPLLNQSAESMGELRQQAEDYGLIISDDAVDASVKFGDSLDLLKRTWRAFKFALGAKPLDFLTKTVDRLTGYMGRLRKSFDAGGFKAAWAEFKTIFSEELKTSATSFSELIGLTDENGNVLDKWSAISKELVGKLLSEVPIGGMLTKLLTFTARNAALIVSDVIAVITDPKVIAGLVDAAKQIVDAAVALLSDPATWDAVKSVLESIVNGLLNLWTTNPTVAAVMSFLAVGKVKKTVGGALNAFGFGASGAGSANAGSTAGAGGKFVGFGKNLLQAGLAYLTVDSAAGAIQEKLSSSGIAGLFKKGIEGVRSWKTVDEISKDLTDYVKEDAEAREAFQDVTETIVTPTKKNGTVVPGFKSLPDKILDFAEDLLGIDKKSETKGEVLKGLLGNASEAIKEYAADVEIDEDEAIKDIFSDYYDELAEQTARDIRKAEALDRNYYDILDKPEYSAEMDETGWRNYTNYQIAKQIAESLHAGGGIDPDMLPWANLNMDLVNRLWKNMFPEDFAADAEESATSFADSLLSASQNASDALSTLDGAAQSAAAALSSILSGEDGSHAKGLWSVPYDNYLARLHRGERVLTASQARQGGGDMNTQSLAAAVKQAVSELVGSLKIEYNGKEFAKVVADTSTKRVHRGIDFANAQNSFSHGAAIKR